MEGENKYCTVLDLATKENDKLFGILSSACMSSILSKRLHVKDQPDIKLTFLMPPDKVITSWQKQGKSQIANIIKRHIVRFSYTIDKLKERTTPIGTLARESYPVTTKSGKVHIGNAEVLSEITEANNGTILKISDQLDPGTKSASAPGPEQPGKKTGKKSAKKTGKKAKAVEEMTGGQPPFDLIDIIGHPFLNGSLVYYDDLSALSGMALRWNILEHYRRKWPLSAFPIGTDHNYYYWLYSSLVLYLKSTIPDFYLTYDPCVDPIIGVEQLLQARITGANYLISDSYLLDWYRSKYWLMSDPLLLSSVGTYLMSGGKNDPTSTGGDPDKTLVYLHGHKTERNVIDPIVANLNKILDNAMIPEQKKRLYVVETFKEIETGDSFRPASATKLYKKVDSDYYYLVPAMMQIQAFLTAELMPTMVMPMVGGNKKKYGDISGGLYMKGGGLSIVIDKYEPTKFDEFACTFFNGSPKDVIYSILQPKKARDYRFKLDLVKQFVNSPFFLLYDQQRIKNVIGKKQYELRNLYTDLGKPVGSSAVPTQTISAITTVPTTLTTTAPQQPGGSISGGNTPMADELEQMYGGLLK